MRNALVEEQIQGLKVNIKPEKKSKLSSVVLKIRGIDQVNSMGFFFFFFCFFFDVFDFSLFFHLFSFQLLLFLAWKG